MEEKRFDPSKLDRLNNPERAMDFPVETVLELAGITDINIAIDYGAGTGFYSKKLANASPNAKIFALDISPVMINWMVENVVNDYPNIIPQLIEDNQTGLDSDKADFLFMVNLHHELYDRSATLTECHRLLKSSAVIAISDWRREPMDKGPSFEIRVEADQVATELKESGFEIITISNDFPNNFLVLAKKK